MNRSQYKAISDAVATGAVAAYLAGGNVQWKDGDGWRTVPPESGPRFENPGVEWRPAPQPQRKPITADEAFELWGKVICDRDGRRCRVSGHDENSLYFINIDGDAEFTTYQQLIDDGYTLDGHVICSGMSTKPQG